MAPRAPSADRGVTALLWAIGLGFYVWLFALAVGVSGAESAIIAALAAGGIFLLVRIYGEKDYRPPRT
jgi:hypothetical protein